MRARRAAGWGGARRSRLLPRLDDRERHGAPLRDREVVLQLVLGQRRGGRGDARVVDAGDDPGRLLGLDLRRGEQAAAGAELARDAALLVEQVDPVAGLRGLGEHARLGGTRLELAGRRVAPDLRPRADDHAQHLAPCGLLEHGAGGVGDARVAEPGLDLVAGALLVAAEADDPHRQLAALDARHERLGERADDGRDAHRGAPVVVVPPDPVPGLDAALAGADPRLDPVDVEEPVDAAAALAPARDAVDLLHEVAAIARLDLEVAPEQPHHRVALAHAGDAVAADRLRAEVPRDGQRALARRLLPRAETAAGRGRGEHGEDGDGGEGAPHPARTSFGNAWTMPARVAPSARRPLDGTATCATPAASVVAVADPSVTVAASTATPRPWSS